MKDMSVKVAVRVRPFNARETKLGCTCVVDMTDPTTILKPYQGQAQRKFTFDYSFWSFDGYQQDADKYFKPANDKYADQKSVFNKIGNKILDNAWEGYHCCLFAYGQTGSGKSYSMIGFGANKGIVPITCTQIFERMKKGGDVEFQVSASMLQIYNQQIQDLLVDISKRPNGGLKIRQNKLLGVYVEGASKNLVNSYKQIEAIMEEGTKNRTVAATQMNATSSRAHTIITIEFRQIKKVGATKSQKVSVINLVDLAGSERQDKTGATGQRFKEAVGINLSLTSLGQVISILAENANGAKKHVPYRNSVLTRILQNALGGNSQTVMICAISPANDNYDETLSTLRYADQAKKIKNKAVVNESETDKIIRELKAENDRLRKLLQQKGTDPNKQLGDKPIQKKQQKPQENKQTEKKIADEQNNQKKQTKKIQQKKQTQPKIQQKKQTQPKIQQQKQTQPKIQQKKQTQPKIQQKKQTQPKIQQKKQTQPKIQQKKQSQPKIQQKKKQTKKKTKRESESESSSSDDDDDDIEKLQAQLLELNKRIDAQIKTTQQKRKEQQKLNEQMIKNNQNNQNNNILSYTQLQQRQKQGIKIPPYFENISKDFMLHRKLKILLQKDKLTIGKLGANPPNDIVFGGRDMEIRHATIQKVENKVFLTPLSSKCHLYRNGQKVTNTIQLVHLDRVIFGWNSVYLFKNKDDQRKDEKIKSKDIDWEFCKQEVEKLVDIDQSDTQDGGGCCNIM